jgi:hypothetical protein
MNGLDALDPFENATPEWFSEVCEAKDSTYGDKSDLLSLWMNSQIYPGLRQYSGRCDYRTLDNVCPGNA